jgi:hypothetical protein
MAAEAVPLSVAWDDNLRITFTPDGDNPLSVADLAGVTAKDLTYSLKAFNLTTTEAVIDDPRLTLKQILQKRGKVTQSLEVQYVFGDAADVARAALVEGTTGQLTLRYSLANDTAWTIGQEVDVIYIECGKQRKDAPVENGVQTITQTLFITQVSVEDEVLVA